TKGIGKWTGLGLSMVHGLAEQSGGTLVLQSERGQGTRAEIWLPAMDGGAAEAPEPVENAALPPAPQRLRILAVDDDALVLMNTAAMLEDLGHEVTAAYSGAEALQQLGQGAYDIVITDHAMPQMTGAQLTEEIERRHPGTRIVLATGYAELPSGVELDLPRLSKPFLQEDLARVLASVTAGTGS